MKKRKVKTKNTKSVSSPSQRGQGNIAGTKHSNRLNTGCLEKSYKRAPQSSRLLPFCTCRCQASFIEQQCHTKLGITEVVEGTDECAHCGYYVHWSPPIKEWTPTDVVADGEYLGSIINSGIAKVFSKKDSMIIDFLDDFNYTDGEVLE